MLHTVRTTTPDEIADVHDLVREAGLPLDGLDTADVVLAAADEDGRLLGTVALERHGTRDPAYLLRSLAVRPAARGLGVGAALTRAALAHADRCAAPVALLTETADGYFPRFGFQQVARAALPAALQHSAELQGACPVSADAMLRPARPS